MRPNWITSGQDFRDYVLNAHLESVNASTVGAGGHGVHVAIFDSVQTLPEGYDQTSIGKQHRYVDTDEDYTTPHGCRVLDMAWEFSPNSTYSFYQIINEDGKMTISALSDAIDQAIDDGVDIVNISSGGQWPGPVEVSPHAREVSRLIDEGIPVVAAAGNYYHNGDRPEVFAPAAVDGVIAVGGCVTKCPTSLAEASSQTESGPYYELANSASANPASPNELYCGQQGCVNGESCISNQISAPWPGNPRNRGDKPDILAPVHCPYTAGDDFDIAYGSSFAAPIVTGVIAEAFGEVVFEGKQLPGPQETRQAVRGATMPLDEGEGGKLNAFELQKRIRSIATSASVTD